MANDRSALTSSERERASVFHSWSAQSTLNPFMVKDAKGVYVTGEDGVTYLDFSSQLVNTNIGHQHPKVVAAIQEQAAVLCTIAPQHAQRGARRGRRLIARPGARGPDKVFFTNGGADANENAIRMARLHTGRHKVLSSTAATTATRRRRSSSPATPGAGRRDRSAGRRALLRAVTPTAPRSGATTEAGVRARARAPRRRSSSSRARRPIAAILIETVVGHRGRDGPAAGIPRGRARLSTSTASSDPRRGHGRLRPHRHVVRLRPLRRHARPHHLRQGLNSGYVRSAA